MGASIKQVIKRIIQKNTILCWIAYHVFGNNKKRMAFLCEKAGAIDSIQNANELLKFQQIAGRNLEEYSCNDPNVVNCRIYGIWYSLFGRCKFPSSCFTPCVEHGMIFYNTMFPDALDTCRASVVTMGSFRKEIIRKSLRRPVFCVGPYIQYATDYYDDATRNELKKRLGNTLLAFLSHANESTFVERQESFLEEIVQLAASFDSVMVNVYWRDIDEALIGFCKANNFKLVSAGFQEDVQFMRRLKCIIELSDYVIGDGIGTHVGYCECLKRPYHLSKSMAIIDHELDCRITDKEKSAALQRVGQIERAYLAGWENRKEQIELCSRYWGIGIKRDQEELQMIVDISSSLVKLSNGSISSLERVSNELLMRYKKQGTKKYNLLLEAMN